jgi:hypothetical protein
MTPWTALLESLHSSTLDELAERFPEEKKELGMPLRQTRFAAPGTDLELFSCKVNFGPASGVALFGIDASLAKAAGTSTAEFWRSILNRAGREFLIRKIQPILEKPKTCVPGSASEETLQKTVWIPLKLRQGRCFIGLGV